MGSIDSYVQKNKWHLKEPISLSSIAIPLEIEDREIIWSHEEIGNNCAIIVLSKKALLDLQFCGKVVYMDGTFKITPKLFHSDSIKGQII